jgi:hypothetical protein
MSSTVVIPPADLFPTTGTGDAVLATSPTLVTPISASLTAPAATALTLAGGSTGASLVLGQGPNGSATLTPAGSGLTIIKGGSDASNALWVATPTFTALSAGTLLRTRFGATSGSTSVAIEALTAGGLTTGGNLSFASSGDVTAQAGSTGASLVLGQGPTAGGLTLTPTGTASLIVNLSGSGSLANSTWNSGGAAGVGFDFKRTTATPTLAGGLASINAYNGTTRAAILEFNGDAATDSGRFDFWVKPTGGGLTQAMTLKSTGNLLIGTTTDISGTGGLHVAGTGTASTTTSGALRVGSNVGLSGNAGGASYFGGNVVSNNASNPIFSAAISGTSIGSFSAFGADVYIGVDQNANGNIIFRRNSATESMRITGSNGAVNIASTVSASSSTVGALTIGNGTAATNVAIGGGVIYAGSKISVNNSGLGGVRMGITSTTGGEIGVYVDSSATTGNNIGMASAPYGAGATSNTGFWANPASGTNNIGFLAGNLTPPAVTASFYGTSKIITTDSTPSTLTTNGALVVTGGVGVSGAMNVGSTVTAGGNVILSQGTYVLLNGAADLNSSLVRLAGNTILGAGADVILKSAGVTVLTGTSSGAATFGGAVTTGGTLTLPKAPAAGNRYILTGADATGTGQLVVQAGGGSASWGGTLNLFETAHATKGGWVGVGLGVANAKFTINSVGFSDSGEVASIDRTGAATFAGAVSLSTAGTTVSIKSGTNAAAGTVTLVGGAGTITSTAIDVNTVIVMSIKTKTGSFDHAPSVLVATGSATIDGHNSDDSTYNWVALKVN